MSPSLCCIASNYDPPQTLFTGRQLSTHGSEEAITINWRRIERWEITVRHTDRQGIQYPHAIAMKQLAFPWL